MFELYDIYDSSEITMLVLIIIIIILMIVVVILFLYVYYGNLKTITKEVLPASNNNIDYEKKYNEIIEKKGDVDVNQVKYSPSEFSTLLKYNPILPYSAFTWDIINNSYLDFNEQSNYDSNYFSLSNYDNIYGSSNDNNNNNNNNNDNNNNSDSDTEKLRRLRRKVQNYKDGKNNNNTNGLLNEDYKTDFN